MDAVLDFETKLLGFDPSLDDFPYMVDELIESVDKEHFESLLPSIFRFFEKYPLNDCGAPGTLVHFIEDFFPLYKDLLIDSISKKPSYNTILMVNRILNSNLSEEERNEYLSLLNSVISESQNPVELIDLAKEFSGYQADK